MATSKQYERHATLMAHMAHAQGVDLDEAILRGDLSEEDLDDAVLRCTGCIAPSACEAWLTGQDPVLNTIPGFCRNNFLFSDLKQGGCR